MAKQPLPESLAENITTLDVVYDEPYFTMIVAIEGLNNIVLQLSNMAKDERGYRNREPFIKYFDDQGIIRVEEIDDISERVCYFEDMSGEKPEHPFILTRRGNSHLKLYPKHPSSLNGHSVNKSCMMQAVTKLNPGDTFLDFIRKYNEILIDYNTQKKCYRKKKRKSAGTQALRESISKNVKEGSGWQ